MPDGFTLILIVIGVLALASGISYFKNKLKPKVFEQIDSVTELAELIIDIVDVDDKAKNEANFVLDTVILITEFAHDAVEFDDKKELSLKLLSTLSEKFGLELDDKTLNLAKIVIDESLDWLDRNYNKQ